ncbi:MAG: LysR family transcriptional regulator [Opitutaceae bacterium]|jgi:DNA-binding transcriptional LysR family regulator
MKAKPSSQGPDKKKSSATPARPKSAPVAPRTVSSPASPGKTSARPDFKSLLKTKGLSIERLRTLVEVDDAGSLIRAAHYHETRAGQYSRQISELESHFGCSLTKREGHSLVLNENGTALALVAREFLRCLEDFTYTQEGIRNPVYNIGAGESLLKWVVVPGLSGLANLDGLAGGAHPSFRLFNLQNSDIVLGLENRTLDFGLIRQESLRPPLNNVRLGPVSYCLCVPRELFGKIAKTDLETLLTTLPLAVHLETSYIQGEFEDYVRGKGLKLNIRLRCDTFPTALAALNTRAYATLMIVLPGLLPLPPEVELIPLKFLAHTRRDIHLAWIPRSEKIRTEMGHIRKALVLSFSWQDP